MTCPPRLEPVHQREELGHHPPLDLPLCLFSPRCDGVDLVDEDDGWCVLLSFLEDLAKLPLALPVILAHDLRAGYRDEVSVDLVRDGLRDERLSGTGRPVEEDTFRWVYPEAFEEFGVAQGELDHLPDQLELPGETADIFVVDIRDLAFLLLLLRLVRSLLQLDLGVLGDNGYPFRTDLGDDEGERVPDHVNPHRLAFHDGAATEYPRQILLSTHQPDRLRGG